MPRRKKDPNAARIQRAVNGLLIPFSILPAVYKHAEQLVADGADDAVLTNGVRAFLGDRL